MPFKKALSALSEESHTADNDRKTPERNHAAAHESAPGPKKKEERITLDALAEKAPGQGKPTRNRTALQETLSQVLSQVKKDAPEQQDQSSQGSSPDTRQANSQQASRPPQRNEREQGAPRRAPEPPRTQGKRPQEIPEPELRKILEVDMRKPDER
jgi:hypothetical protein